MKTKLLISGAALALLAGCSGTPEQNAAVGGLSGAAGGLLLGGPVGAVVGGAAGGAAGYGLSEGDQDIIIDDEAVREEIDESL